MAKKKKSKPSPVLVQNNVASAEPASCSTSNSNVQYIGRISTKICRLCEGSGPFLDIFTEDKETSKQIAELMPFVVAEHDELPQKICFRCSAKLEELHEFVGKCVKTQENFCRSLGKKGPTIRKIKTHRYYWEEKLNKFHKTNDDICDAVIKKSIESIRGILPYLDVQLSGKIISATIAREKCSKVVKAEIPNKTNENEPQLKDEVKKLPNHLGVPNRKIRKSANITEVESNSEVPPENQVKRTSRSNKTEPLLEGLEDKSKKTHIESKLSPIKNSVSVNNPTNRPVAVTPSAAQESKNVKSPNEEKAEKKVKEPEDPKKEFDIMDHVMLIKVRGVGILYQCKLCNKNFLKKYFFLTHWCAKNGSAKEDFPRTFTPPQPPKAPTVKYINTNENGEIKKMDNKTNIKPESKSDDAPVVRKKPRIGPASKVKRAPEEDSIVGTVVYPQQLAAPPAPPPPKPPAPTKFNLPYKHIVGQSNVQSFTKSDNPRKRKLDDDCSIIDDNGSIRNTFQQPNKDIVRITKYIAPSTQTSEQDIRQKSAALPYPVGLFRTLNQTGSHEPSAPVIVPFITPAQKKQTYTVIKTDHPNKLLISTRPIDQEKVSPKKQKKQRHSPKEAEKDPNFFTFVNVDPMLTPSYVLPTNNTVIQESQISTSAAARSYVKSSNVSQVGNIASNYTCNICNAVFTREQKLLVHINSHYNEMDAADEQRTMSKKRPKKTK